jgi:hypothetical protein
VYIFRFPIFLPKNVQTVTLDFQHVTKACYGTGSGISKHHCCVAFRSYFSSIRTLAKAIFGFIKPN